jgi:hypothetical protein
VPPTTVYFGGSQIGAKTELQPLVVCFNGLPVDCRHIWPYGQRVQHLRTGPAMARVYPSGELRSTRGLHLRSTLVREFLAWIVKVIRLTEASQVDSGERSIPSPRSHREPGLTLKHGS